MGISGLLPFVKPASTEKHIKEFKGQTAAIDSYCWLHKGAFGCAEKLAMGQQTDGYIQYCFKYIDMLQLFKIKPIMVFDGQHLPAKLLTEKKRRESRNQAKKRATECLKLGNIVEARNHFRRCVDITAEMAFEFIKECRKRNIDCVVAPYEADSQLAYLNRTKMADFVISEDSDLLTFGCSKVLFKLDLTGRGTLVESDKLYLATKDRVDEFSFDRFRYMCILSGCDYLESLPGIGLKKALKFVQSMPNDDIYNNMVKLPKTLNMANLVVTKEYREQFMIADATFRHQLVFDVINKKLVPLIDPTMCGTDLQYCCNSGKMLDDHLAYQIAVGNYNPFTHKEMSNWTPQKSNFGSIWCRSSYTDPQKIVTQNNIFKPQIKTSIKIEKPCPVPEEPTDDKAEEKMLMMYSIKKIEAKIEPKIEEEPPAKRICLQKRVEDTTPEKDVTSPVLNGRKQFINPFLKRSRNNLSNQFEKEEKVVSKYFCSETNDDQSVKTDDVESIHFTMETKHTTIETKHVSVETKQSTMEIKQESNVTMETINQDSDDEELQSSLKENDDSQSTSTTLSTESQEIKQELESKLEIFSKNVVKPPLVKCRPQGLLRSNNKNNNNKFKPGKSQPTLLSMFGFKKK